MTILEPDDDVQARLERALGIPPGSGCVAVAGRVAGDETESGEKGESRGATAVSPRPGLLTPDPAPGRWRIPAGLLLVAVLGAAYVVVTRVDRAPAAGTSQRLPATSVGTVGTTDARPSDPIGALLAHLPDPWRTSCRAAPGLDAVAVGAVACTPRGASLASVEIRVFRDAAQMHDRYADLATHDLPSGGSGGPHCASGANEERGWALPATPGAGAGRYACRVEAGVASMWWTADSSNVLVHAVRTDADLAALFNWWRSDASQYLG